MFYLKTQAFFDTFFTISFINSFLILSSNVHSIDWINTLKLKLLLPGNLVSSSYISVISTFVIKSIFDFSIVSFIIFAFVSLSTTKLKSKLFS
ncbi:MAG: hypothetical protein Q8S84_01745 [bacterium]|nr:hypothetical protein [bacterium]